MTVNTQSFKAFIRKSVFLISAFLFFPLFMSAHIAINDRCLDAYKSILSLKFEKASAILKEEEKADPDNLFPVYLEDYIDFLSAFISESDTRYAQYGKNFDKRLSLIKKGDKNSPYLNLFLDNMQLHYALTQVRFGDNLSSATSFSAAFHSFEDNENRFPAFLSHKTGLGLTQILAAMIPDNYQWMLSMLGISGETETGLKALQKVVDYSGNDEFINIGKMEAIFLMAITGERFSTNKKIPLQIMQRFAGQQTGFPTQDNPLYIFARAKIFSAAGLNDKAIEVLSLYRPGPGDFPFFYLSYMMGAAKLNRLDRDGDLLFGRYIANASGKNFIKSSYQRLAWDALLKGDHQKYEQYRKLTLSQGSTRSESDKQAQKEASFAGKISVPLLKARLLFDGGYYDRSLDILLGTRMIEVILSKKDLVEYHYRLGRIYQETGQTAKALESYNQTILKGSGESWYFAANAALQSGLIMESQKKFAEAAVFFRRCLSMENTEYKNSLDQKAKAGLKRIKSHLP